MSNLFIREMRFKFLIINLFGFIDLKVHRLLPTNCLSVFNHFVGLALKGVKGKKRIKEERYLNKICFSEIVKQRFFLTAKAIISKLLLQPI